MEFNLDAVFGNPVFIGIMGFTGVLLLALIIFVVVTSVRGGFGRFSRPKQVVQRCFCITSANVLVFFKLKVTGEYAIDVKNKAAHFMFGDALIAERRTGQMYLPIDDRASSPDYPLEPEVFKTRLAQAQKAMSFIAAVEDQKQQQEAVSNADTTASAEMQKFALVFSFGILLVIVLGILIMNI